MSVDGLIAGPNTGVEHPVGEAGTRLHDWMFALPSGHERQDLAGEAFDRSTEVVNQWVAASGVYVMGRHMFTCGEGPSGDRAPYPAPIFVLSHNESVPVIRNGKTAFTFVTDGIGSALEQARAAAGDKGVGIAGGANTVQQFLKAGLLDEIQVQVVPVLLGAGTRLFEHLGVDHIEPESIRDVESPGVTHLKYRIVR